MSDESVRAVLAIVREQFRLAERTAAMTAQVLVPRTKKPPLRVAIETGSRWAAVPKRLKEEFDYD